MDEDGISNEEQAPPLPQFSFPLVSLIQRTQGEHGVKHADFTRYR